MNDAGPSPDKHLAEPTRSQKHNLARDSLPEDLRPPFDALVADYIFYALIHHRTRLVSYLILADLVRAGWRPPAAGEGEAPQLPEPSE